MPLTLTDKGLFLLGVNALITSAQASERSARPTKTETFLADTMETETAARRAAIDTTDQSTLQSNHVKDIVQKEE